MLPCRRSAREASIGCRSAPWICHAVRDLSAAFKRLSCAVGKRFEIGQGMFFQAIGIMVVRDDCKTSILIGMRMKDTMSTESAIRIVNSVCPHDCPDTCAV